MTRPRYGVLAAGILVEFVAVLVILVAVIPGPRKQIDYLVIGTLATFVALGTLFAILQATTMRDVTAFSKEKQPRSKESRSNESS
jgi:hypothetical protein